MGNLQSMAITVDSREDTSSSFIFGVPTSISANSWRCVARLFVTVAMCSSANFIHNNLTSSFVTEKKIPKIQMTYNLQDCFQLLDGEFLPSPSISTIKALRSQYRSSLAPILENNLLTMPMRAWSARTNEPTCAKMAIKVVWRRNVDFPVIFGPVMTCKLDEGVISIFNGIGRE